jgi:hypothetical protein
MVCKEHNICIKSLGKTASCVVVVDLEKDKILLGNERYGRNKNKYNICCGTMEIKDNQCYFNLAIRELKEEFKLNFEDCYDYKYFNGFIIPVFIVYFKSINIDEINKKITNDNNNLILPKYCKEINDLKYFDIFESILNDKVTSFSKKIIKKYL